MLLQMFVGSFEPDDFNSFQTDVAATFKAFEAAKLTHLIVDLSNNGGASPSSCARPQTDKVAGGYVCLGQFLHEGPSATGLLPSVYVPEGGDVTNVLLHTMYGLSCLHFYPSLETVDRSMDAMSKYGMSIAAHTTPQHPLYHLILSLIHIHTRTPHTPLSSSSSTQTSNKPSPPPSPKSSPSPSKKNYCPRSQRRWARVLQFCLGI